MPSFDVVSEVDLQEVRNAVDQASREAGTRFDFKGTDSTIELSDHEIVLESVDRGPAEGAEPGAGREARAPSGLAQGSRPRPHRRSVQGPGPSAHTLRAGISAEHGKRINKLVKDLGLKGVTSQVQGEQVRVTGKKRDDLQAVIQALEGAGSRDPAAVPEHARLSTPQSTRSWPLSQRPHVWRGSETCQSSIRIGSSSSPVTALKSRLKTDELEDPENPECEEVGRVHKDRRRQVARSGAHARRGPRMTLCRSRAPYRPRTWSRKERLPSRSASAPSCPRPIAG